MKVKSINKTLFSLGLVLSILGIPAVALVKIGICQNLSILSILIQILSCLLLFNYREMFSYPLPTSDFTAILLYIFYVLFLAFISDFFFMQPPFGFIYQLFYVLQIIFLWNNVNRVDFDQLSRFLSWCSGVLTLIALFFIIQNFRSTGSFFFQGLGLDEFKHFVVSRSTTATLAFITLIIVFLNKQLSYFWKYIFGVAALLVMISSNRRSINGTILLIIILYFLRGGNIKINRKQLVMFIINIIILVIGGILIYMCVPSVHEILNHSIDSFSNAIGTYFGSTTVWDLSASYRQERLSTIPQLYLFDSTFKEFLLGRGYMTDWLDIPYLQAFWDLGLLGGIYFIVIQFILPLYYVFKKTDIPFIKFTQYYVFLRIMLNCASGLPYANSFFPLVLLMVLFRASQKNDKSMEQTIK